MKILFDHIVKINYRKFQKFFDKLKIMYLKNTGNTQDLNIFGLIVFADNEKNKLSIKIRQNFKFIYETQ